MARRFVFLYTELAPYFLACVDQLLRVPGVEVHIVRWPVNEEAPFDLRFGERLKVYERARYTGTGLVRLIQHLAPDAVFVSGWVDKAYMIACRAQRAAGRTVVLCMDTAWTGAPRQWAAVCTRWYWVRPAFSHAWVTGERQRTYARKLGIPDARIATGFYSADVDRSVRSEPMVPLPHRFLCVARYIPTKGHQVLCDAFAHLCEAGKAGDWELWSVGTGESFDQVSRSATGAHPRIRHLGFRQAHAMGEVRDQCGVFVVPSMYEPWGVVVHEHAAAGFPLLLTDAVGAGERFLEPGWNGWRCAAGDVRSLQEALQAVVGTSDAELRTMGARSAERGRAWNPAEWARTALELCDRQ